MERLKQICTQSATNASASNVEFWRPAFEDNSDDVHISLSSFFPLCLCSVQMPPSTHSCICTNPQCLQDFEATPTQLKHTQTKDTALHKKKTSESSTKNTAPRKHDRLISSSAAGINVQQQTSSTKQNDRLPSVSKNKAKQNLTAIASSKDQEEMGPTNTALNAIDTIPRNRKDIWQNVKTNKARQRRIKGSSSGSEDSSSSPPSSPVQTSLREHLQRGRESSLSLKRNLFTDNEDVYEWDDDGRLHAGVIFSFHSHEVLPPFYVCALYQEKEIYSGSPLPIL